MSQASPQVDAHLPNAAPEAVYDIIRRIRPLFRHLVSAVEQNLVGTGISVSMRGVLELLAEAGPQTVPQIARALILPRQNVQVIVNALLALEAVEAHANPGHKRSPIIRLTTSGLSTFAQIKAGEMAVIMDAGSGLATSEVEACIRVLEHLKGRFGEIAQSGSIHLPVEQVK
ncbi:MAG TPA: MarR family transcriptional regulator [Microvirga sp.]